MAPRGVRDDPWGGASQHPLDTALPPVGKRGRRRRVFDVILTVVLLLALADLTLIVSISRLYLSMEADSCGIRDCDTDLIALGMLFAAVISWVALAIAAILSIVLLILRRWPSGCRSSADS